MDFQALIPELLGQSLLAGILFFFLYTVWKAYLEEKDKKDTMAEALIKITQLWDERYSKETTDDREIKELMKEIRDFVRDLTKGRDAK